MIEQLTDLPDRVIGFQVSGKLRAEDYTETLIPVVERAAKQGGVRIVLVIDQFEGLSAGAVWEDITMGVEHLRVWKRIALVTDIDWMVHVAALFGWMTPGELKIFPIAEREAAIAWAAA